jgi:hypothetical protein
MASRAWTTGLQGSIVLLGAWLCGCEETVEGKYLDTEGIAMVVDVTARSEGAAELEIEFKSGGDESNTYVDLDGDTVSASGGDETFAELDEDRTGRYTADFGTGEGGTEFSVSLDRSDEDKTDALDSQGVLPDAFAITLDPETDVSRAGALLVTWDPAGGADEVRIDADGDCLFFTFAAGEEDDGEYVIEAGEFVLGGTDDEEDCEATLTVTRTNFGEVDSVFDSESKFRLHQERSVTFTSTP